MRPNAPFTALVGLVLSATIAAAADIETLATLDQRPGNPAVAPDGTIYVSMHPFDSPEHKVLRLAPDGTARPYPTPQMSREPAGVIGITATDDGTLWFLDMGSAETSPKLVGWSTAEDELVAVHYLPIEASVPTSFHQDFVIDEERGRAFIADMSQGDMTSEPRPAIVVVDLETGRVRRVLEGFDAFLPTDGPFRAEGRPMTFTADGQTQPVALGLNPIGIDEGNRWVYVSTMTPGPIHRIPAETLGDFAASEEAIAAAFEVFGEKPSSDGIAVSGETVYVTDIDRGAILAVTGGESRVVAEAPDMVWPDGIAVAPDGSLVVTVNQLNRAAPFNGGTAGAEPPFRVVRITEE